MGEPFGGSVEAIGVVLRVGFLVAAAVIYATSSDLNPFAVWRKKKPCTSAWMFAGYAWLCTSPLRRLRDSRLRSAARSDYVGLLVPHCHAHDFRFGPSDSDSCLDLEARCSGDGRHAGSDDRRTLGAACRRDHRHRRPPLFYLPAAAEAGMTAATLRLLHVVRRIAGRTAMSHASAWSK